VKVIFISSSGEGLNELKKNDERATYVEILEGSVEDSIEIVKKRYSRGKKDINLSKETELSVKSFIENFSGGKGGLCLSFLTINAFISPF
jgi:hypothetical protein